MNFCTSALLVFVVLKCTFGAHLPSNFHTCSRTDPNFNECLRSSVEDAIPKLANGVKELSIIPVEPLRIELISVARVPGSSVSIDQKFTNLRLHGLTHLKVTKMEVDMEKNRMYCETFTPELRSEADFEIKGQLLIFPINGKGPSNVTLTNLKSIHDITFERYQKKGKEYVRVIKYKLTLKPEKIHYKFENFLNGQSNLRLQEEIHRTINENSIAIFEEVRPATEESYGIIFQQIANKIFTKIPLNEIFTN